MKIQDKQNQPKSLAKLAANGVLYRQAKRMRNLALVLVISAGILAIVNLGAEKRTFEHVVTFIVLFSWFIDEIMLKTLEAKFKKEAAAIQEAFDCFVFDIPWPEYKDISYPTADRINHLEGKATTHTLRKDWYPPGAIPNDPLLAIAHCQRTNCWWDVNLRRKWKSTLLVVFSVFGRCGNHICHLNGYHGRKNTHPFGINPSA